jgi:hypothetical protein
MSGELTQFGANRAITAGVGLAVAATSGIYIALATNLPSSPDTASLSDFATYELTTGGYSRQQVNWGSPSGDPSEISNTDPIEFGPFTSDPPQVTHAFLCDTSIGTSGNVLAYWQLDTARDASTNDILRFGAGTLKMRID